MKDHSRVLAVVDFHWSGQEGRGRSDLHHWIQQPQARPLLTKVTSSISEEAEVTSINGYNSL